MNLVKDLGQDKQNFEHKIENIHQFKSFVLGAKNICLIETVHLSADNVIVDK